MASNNTFGNSSIRRNYAFNLINTLSGLLFPLITFPYLSRILLAEGIGKFQFFQSIIDYIILCCSLGIPLYAIREIARIRDDEKKYSITTIEILLLHGLLTLGGYIIVFILASTISIIKVDIPLFLLLSINICFNTVGVVWFYQAIEDFKYITIRTLVIRILSLIALFVFVKDKNDLFIYALITVIANSGSNIFNFIRLRKYIKIHKIEFKRLSLSRHLKPALQIFVLNLIISIYVNLDSVMLGFLKDQEAVGYYTAATRLTRAVLAIVASMGRVLLPRFSNLIITGEKKEFTKLANKTISFAIGLSLPMFIGLLFMARPIIELFCGEGFEPSILTLQLISPIIFIISLSNVIGIQILYPQGKEIIVIIATAIGAATNFSLNWILIPHMSQYGAAITTSIAELIVFVLMIGLGHKYLPFKLINRQNTQYIIASLLITIVLTGLSYTHLQNIPFILISITICSIIYISYLLIVKDPFIYQILRLIKR